MKFRGNIKTLQNNNFTPTGKGYIKFFHNKVTGEIHFLEINFESFTPVKCPHREGVKYCWECSFYKACCKRNYTTRDGETFVSENCYYGDVFEGVVSEDSSLIPELLENISDYIKED